MAKPEPTTPTVPPADYPGAALDAAIEAARIAAPVIFGADGAAHAFVPAGFQLQKLPNDRRIDPWPRRRVTVDDNQSLIQYCRRHAGPDSVLIADYDKGEVTARLDWMGARDGTRWPDPAPDAHSVTLHLRPSEEFTRWNAFAGKHHTQEDFARFLEENSSDIVSPDPATMIELARDFEATVGQSYKASVRLDNGDRKLMFQTESNATNGVVVPQRFTLMIPVYNGEDPEPLTCLFRWRANGNGGLTFAFEWHRLEYMRRARFTLIATEAAEQTGLPVFMGRVAS